MGDRAAVFDFKLCYRGDTFALVLAVLYFVFPFVVFITIFGVSIRNRDIFLFVVSTIFTWVIFMFLELFRNLVVMSPRPYYVSECSASYALPDTWFVVTLSFVLTIFVSVLIYRRTDGNPYLLVNRYVSMLVAWLVVALYIAAPLVNREMYFWQFAVNMLMSFAIAFFAVLIIFLWASHFFVRFAHENRFLERLGFVNCFLSEVDRKHKHEMSERAERRANKKRQSELSDNMLGRVLDTLNTLSQDMPPRHLPTQADHNNSNNNNNRV